MTRWRRKSEFLMILSPYKQSNAEGKEHYKTYRKLSEQAKVIYMSFSVHNVMYKEQNQAYIAINSEQAVLNSRKVLESSVRAHWNRGVNVNWQTNTSTHWLPTEWNWEQDWRQHLATLWVLPHPHLGHLALDYAPPRSALWSKK